MSSSNSFSSTNSNRYGRLSGEIEEENEGFDVKRDLNVDDGDSQEDDTDMDAYFDEPIADEAWLAEYRRKKQEEKERLEELELRWNGSEPVASWCSCGNCDIGLLENVKECRCCSEINNCVKCLEDLGDDNSQLVKCIVDHPGFSAICLNIWSLELAAENFKTRDGRRYRQSDSKERFLRVVAYRQFTRLVHGRLKDKRIPLPSCAYNAVNSLDLKK